MKNHRIYIVGQYEQNSQVHCDSAPAAHPYHNHLRRECGHTHTTISGARRCLRRLSKFYRDGSHNEWAHFGKIIPLKPCGHPDKPTDQEYEEINYIEPA